MFVKIIQVSKTRLSKPNVNPMPPVRQTLKIQELDKSLHNRTGSPSSSMLNQLQNSYASLYQSVELGRRLPLSYGSGSATDYEMFRLTKRGISSLEEWHLRIVSCSNISEDDA
jgi:hypothetical protein